MQDKDPSSANPIDPIAIAEEWKATIALRQAQSQAMAEALQEAVDASGLLEKGINPLDRAFHLDNLNEEVRRELEEKAGFVFDADEEGTKPDPKHPSNWKQRTRAMRV